VCLRRFYLRVESPIVAHCLCGRGCQPASSSVAGRSATRDRRVRRRSCRSRRRGARAESLIDPHVGLPNVNGEQRDAGRTGSIRHSGAGHLPGRAPNVHAYFDQLLGVDENRQDPPVGGLFHGWGHSRGNSLFRNVFPDFTGEQAKAVQHYTWEARIDLQTAKAPRERGLPDGALMIGGRRRPATSCRVKLVAAWVPILRMIIA
jgi:hypothetical protein